MYIEQTYSVQDWNISSVGKRGTEKGSQPELFGKSTLSVPSISIEGVIRTICRRSNVRHYRDVALFLKGVRYLGKLPSSKDF